MPPKRSCAAGSLQGEGGTLLPPKESGAGRGDAGTEEDLKMGGGRGVVAGEERGAGR